MEVIIRRTMADEVKAVLVPTKVQALVSFMLALVLVVSLYFEALVNRLPITGTPYLQESFIAQLAKLNQVSFIRTGVIVMFWSIVGLVSYTAYVTIANAVIEARNEAVIEMEYTNRGQGVNRYRGFIIQATLGLVLIALLAISALWGLPLWFGLVNIFLAGSISPIGVAAALGGLLGLAANLYFIWMLGQLVHIADEL